MVNNFTNLSIRKATKERFKTEIIPLMKNRNKEFRHRFISYDEAMNWMMDVYEE